MPERICASPECGEPAAPKTRANGPAPEYCSRKCQSRTSYLRSEKTRRRQRYVPVAYPRAECVVCGSEFQPPRKDSQTCTRACNRRLHRDSSSERCTTPDCLKMVRAKGLCVQHYKAQHPNRKTWKKNGNPNVRRAALRKRTQVRRALLRDPDAEVIDRDEIGVRDGWKCGLCSTKVDNSLAYPHPLSASLDHIEPLSLGGRHAKANVQIAHLRCNVAKGNRAAGEQLLLFG